MQCVSFFKKLAISWVLKVVSEFVTYRGKFMVSDKEENGPNHLYALTQRHIPNLTLCNGIFGLERNPV
jgi:hypothetical protein